MNDKEQRQRFAEIVMPHLGDAFRLARWLTGNRSDAEDVMQEMALRAFQNISQYRGDSARGWVLAILRNTALSWLGKNRAALLNTNQDVDTLPETQDIDDVTPETLLLGKLEAERVRQAVGALPLAFREIVALREFHGLSYREMAEITGLPLGTIMSRLSRARHMLMLHLAGERS